uniref:Unplaced genomic scaffold supercont1.8, whole genome shotgun sequence n=2 Tax=Cryptococcus bacillisporus CA1280 TaxID=1296109 RepID=A0A0D0VMK0_CRYGA|nr:hypothetical protein I312_03377 [Cryptococcus bacillisporus CA1280]
MKYDTLAPKFGPLFHCIVMIIDIVVAHRLKLEGDVKSVEVVDVYWLGTVAFIMSVLWFLAEQYDGYLRRLEARNNDEIKDDKIKESSIATRVANVAYSWWPWREAGQRGTAVKRDVERTAGKRKERKRDKRGKKDPRSPSPA